MGSRFFFFHGHRQSDNSESNRAVADCRNAGRDKPPPCCDVRTSHQSQPSHSWPTRGSSINVFWRADESGKRTWHAHVSSTGTKPERPEARTVRPKHGAVRRWHINPYSFHAADCHWNSWHWATRSEWQDPAAMWTRSCTSTTSKQIDQWSVHRRRDISSRPLWLATTVSTGEEEAN